jgi:hypothetical protein
MAHTGSNSGPISVGILNNFHGLKIKTFHGFYTILNHNFNKTNTLFTFYLFFFKNPRCTAREEKKYGSFGKKKSKEKNTRGNEPRDFQFSSVFRT